ncbi:hypothetical protein C0581_00465 [Candidatus Parcubacteria bacterium]|mgnify:CR=1 FL=1|nr:MAG: hypothetical protein C0581_00465 [Candidatus Parcubacteria bacterium]
MDGSSARKLTPEQMRGLPGSEDQPDLSVVRGDNHEDELKKWNEESAKEFVESVMKRREIPRSKIKPASGTMTFSLSKEWLAEKFNVIGEYYGSIDGKRDEKRLLVVERTEEKEGEPKFFLHDDGQYDKRNSIPTSADEPYRVDASEDYTVLKSGDRISVPVDLV